jgi:ribose transport system ATP-binding protein
MTSEQHVVLRMRGIEKSFGPQRALRGVNLEVRAAEVHALIGENGAGKSTLMKVLSGAHAHDAGSMELRSKPYAPASPRAARQAGVAMIYQELALAPHLTVAENIVLGSEPRRFGLVDRHAVRARVTTALSQLGHPNLAPDRKVHALSPGERQLVEVARALSEGASLVVMDEPTSSLSRHEVEQLFLVIERLRARAVSIIYISHFLDEIQRIAQRYTILRDGATVESGDVPRADEDGHFATHVIEAMAGRRIAEAYPRVAHRRGADLFELQSISASPQPEAASLVLARGEIVGIFGLMGSGRTELLRALFGLVRLRAGKVRVGGVWDEGRTPQQRLGQGIGLSSENRKEEGLALGMSIADNLTLSKPLSRWGLVSASRRDAATRTLSERLRLRYREPSQAVGELSGGNQQKVALLRLLHHGVDVWLLDEPTRGIDVGSKAEIYRLMGELAAQGKAILFVSSYLPELLGVCDRIAVMSRGVLGAARPVEGWSEASLLSAATEGSARAEVDAKDRA